MNIGILITRFPPDVLAGAELQAQQAARELARRGHCVTVFTRRSGGKPRWEEKDGVTICRRRELPIPGIRMFWDLVPALFQIARRKPRPEVLLCYQTFNSGFIGVVAQAVLGIPAVVSIRGNGEYRLRASIINRMLVPGIYRRARRLAVQTPRIEEDLISEFAQAGRADLVNLIRDKTTVIANGIVAAGGAAPRSTGSRNKIVFVGRLVPNKGVSDLLAALRRLPTSEAVIVGDGPDRKRLETLAEGLRVTFVGQVRPEEISGYLRDARVLVLPSHRGDGLPNVILEAMSQGVPVIATRTAGIPDLVIENETGLLYSPGDVAALAEQLEQLETDDALRERLGANSLREVRRYSWDVVTPQIEQLLHSATTNLCSTASPIS